MHNYTKLLGHFVTPEFLIIINFGRTKFRAPVQILGDFFRWYVCAHYTVANLVLSSVFSAQARSQVQNFAFDQFFEILYNNTY
jgi:hypothetical protein